MEYNFKNYIYSKDVWDSFWYQIKEAVALKPKNILEIGKGNGVVSDCLKKEGIKVTTLDNDKETNPDILWDINKGIKLEDNSFDLVMCCEVLEHQPFWHMPSILKEMTRVSSEYVIISIPHYNLSVRFQLFINARFPHLFFVHGFKGAIRIPFPKKHHHKGEHYWEAGKRHYSLRKIRRIIKPYFIILNEYIMWENQQHRFFILKKR